MKKKKGRVKAIYIIAALWLLSTIGFPIFSIIKFLVLGGISVVAFGVLTSIFGKKGGEQGSNGQAQNTQNTQVPGQTTINPGLVSDTTTRATGTANPYSSTMRYSAAPHVETEADRTRAAKKAAREAKKAARQAAKTKKAREEAMKAQAEIDRIAAEEKAMKEAAEAEKKAKQSLAERYNVHKRTYTGDSAIDKMIDDEEMAIAEMRRLDDAIEDAKVSEQIVHLEDVTTKIVSYVIEHPAKRNQVRRFFSYYLPTSIKLLNAYDRMDEAGISGMNIDGTKGKVEEMMDTALEAFDKQLDALYADEALDVSTEIKVMESLLSQEGLKDEFAVSEE